MVTISRNQTSRKKECQVSSLVFGLVFYVLGLEKMEVVHWDELIEHKPIAFIHSFIAGLAQFKSVDLNHDLNRDLNQMIFFFKSLI